MVILYPSEDQSYQINWIWKPLDELKDATRYVQWAGQSDYQRVDADTWEVEERRPSQVPTKHYKFRVRLNDQVVTNLTRDTNALEALKRKIEAA